MSQSTAHAPRVEIDVRGPRFVATVTTVVLAAILLTLESPVGAILLSLQALVFAIGAFAGVKAQPYSVVFRTVVQPRLAPPAEFEDAAPPRFAFLVGFIFTGGALIALATGVTVLAYVLVAMALAAAFLNAAFGFCLGCEMYLIGRRIFARPVSA